MEESEIEGSPNLPFTKLTRDKDDLSSETYVKSLHNFNDYIYDIRFNKDSPLETINPKYINYPHLYSITLPPSLITIKPGSFQRCLDLFQVIFLKNDDNENLLKYIGKYAFRGTSLESITITANVQQIGDYCFPTSLKSIVFEENARNLEKIGNHAFDGAQFETFFMPSNTKPFLNSDCIFKDCKQLHTIVFDRSVNKDEPAPTDREEEDEFESMPEKKENFFKKYHRYEAMSGRFCGYYEEEDIESYDIPSYDPARSYMFSGIKLEKLEIFSSKINNFFFSNTPYLTMIEIPSKENSRYVKERGILYTKNQKKLIVAERNIKDATIPSKCKIISNYAFNFDSFEKVSFEKNSELEEISVFAFSESNIKKLTIPDSVDNINLAAFYKCRLLESVNLPNSLRKVGQISFSFTKLTEVTIPKSVIVIEYGSFYQCSQLKKIEFENESNLLCIEPFAFAKTSIEKVDLPNSCISLGEYCFANCENLKIFNIKKDSYLEKIGQGCFKGTQIEEFTLPLYIKTFDLSYTEAKVVNVANDCQYLNQFYSLSSTQITTITIPPTVRTITKHAFFCCSSLKEVKIFNLSDSNLNEIEIAAFYGCVSLTTFDLPKTVRTFKSECFKNTPNYNAQINLIVDDKEICIENNAFENSGITSFKSKSKKIEVSRLAFKDCQKLTLFSSDVEIECAIKESSFMNCSSLKTVKLTKDVPKIEIGESCFMNSSIESFDVPVELKDIPKSCFKNCKKLKQIKIHNNSRLEHLYNEAFYNSGIESIFISFKIVKIHKSCFENCEKLKEVSFAKDKPSLKIGERAFANSGLEQFYVGKFIWTIGCSCFENCSNLKKLTFSSSSPIYVIKESTFRSSGIESLILPKKVEFIQKHAFENCQNLQTVTFNYSNVQISKYAFSDCSNLCKIKCKSEITVEIIQKEDWYQLPIQIKFNQVQIDKNIIDRIFVSKIPFLDSIPSPIWQYSLQMNKKWGTMKNVQTYSFYNFVVEYHEGGYYFDSMKELLFVDFLIEEITIPKETKVIEQSALKFSNVKKINFEEDSQLTKISDFSFESLPIEEISIPDTVTFIGESAFRDCFSLKKVQINATSQLKTIGPNAFEKTSIEQILFPSKLTTVGDYAFYECFKLTEVENQSNKITFGEHSFQRSSIEKINFPVNSTFAYSAFKECSKLKALNFLDKPKKVIFEEESFALSGLEELKLKGNFDIKENAFIFCPFLQTLSLGSKYIKVLDNSLSCSNISVCILNLQFLLDENNYERQTFINSCIDKIRSSKIKKCSLKLSFINKQKEEESYNEECILNHRCFVLNESLVYADLIDNTLLFEEPPADKKEIIKKNEVLQVPSKVKKLDFPAMTHVKRIIWASDCLVDDLGSEGNFSYYRLTEIMIPKLVTKIPNKLFLNCHFLKTVKFEEGSILEEVGEFAFFSIKIAKIILPTTCKVIGNCAFMNCCNLKEVSFEGETIGDSAFQQTGLLSFNLSNKTRTIGSDAFRYCHSLTSFEIDIDDSILSEIGISALAETPITTINIPRNVEKIEKFTFEGCRFLREVNISPFSKLEKIDSQAFLANESLKRINIPKSILYLFNENFLKEPPEISPMYYNCQSFDAIENQRQKVNEQQGKEEIETCSLIFNFSEGNTVKSLINRCYVINQELVYANQIDNALLTEKIPLEDKNKGKPKPNEILQVPNPVIKLNFPPMPHIKKIQWGNKCIVNDIGPPGFFSYYRLTEITIPKLVEVIPERLFEHCHFLRNVQFEKGSKLREIGAFSFANTKVEKVFLPKTVEVIRASAFFNNQYLQDILFEGEEIEDEAFSQTGLTVFSLSNNTKSIGDGVFRYCRSLTTIKINILSSNLSEIGSYAFSETGITTINIPQNVKVIKSFTFDGCTALKEVNFSPITKLEKIEKNAFPVNSSLTKINLPKSVVDLFNKLIKAPTMQSIMYDSDLYFDVIDHEQPIKVNQSEIETCSLLLNFCKENPCNSFTNKCYVIDSELVYADMIDNTPPAEKSPRDKNKRNVLKKNEVLQVPNNVTKLNFPPMPHIRRIVWGSKCIVNDLGKPGSFAYYRLIELTIPKLVEVIPERLCEHCHSLKVLQFEEGSVLKEIGASSFAHTKIEKLEIPSSVQVIHQSAFYDIPCLQEVTFEGEIIEDEAFSETGITMFTLSNNTKTISEKAFYHCLSLTTFNIDINNSNLTSIGSSAFSETAIKTINVPAGVNSIEAFTFENCQSLQEVIISPKSKLESIGKYAFNNCQSLVKINIPNTIANLSYKAFVNTPSLCSILKESNEKFILFEDNSVYSNDRTLVFVPRNLREFKVIPNCLVIHSSAFCGPNLSKVSFSDSSLIKIEKCAFAHSTGLKSMSIPNSIRYIGNEAFIDCQKLTKVVFEQGSKIKQIPKSCFAYSGLKTIKLASSIEIICHSSFSSCSNLKNINLHNTKTKIVGDYAFSDCNINKAKFPASVEYIGGHSFDGNKSLMMVDFTRLTEIDEDFPPLFTKVRARSLRIKKNAFKILNQSIQNQSFTQKEINNLNNKIRKELAKQQQQQQQQQNNNNNQADFNNNQNDIISPRRKPTINTNINGPKRSNNAMLSKNPQIIKPNQPSRKGKNKNARTSPRTNLNVSESLPVLPPSSDKGNISPRRFNRNQQSEEATNDFNQEEITNEDENEIEEQEDLQLDEDEEIDVKPASKCFIHNSAFMNCNVKTFKCNCKEFEWFSFFEKCNKIDEYISNESCKSELTKLEKESINKCCTTGDSFRFTKLEIDNQETVPLCENQHLLKEFVITNSITRMPFYRFSECTSLTKITFAKDSKVDSITEYCFQKTALKEISIPASVKYMGVYAFYSCLNLEKVTFDDDSKLVLISDWSFCECNKLTSIRIPSSVEKIGKFVFYSCPSLEKVSFADGSQLKKIEEGAFSKCQKLTTIELPNKIEEIPKSCFAYSGLQKITLPKSIKKVCSKSFYECRTLSEINLNSGIEMIESYSFYNNISIKELDIPSSLKVLKEYSFCGCENLCKFNTTADTELVEIEEGTFENTNLSELRINRKATKLFTPRNIKTLNSINFYGGSPTHFILTEEGNIYEPIEPKSINDISKIDLKESELEFRKNLENDFILSTYYYLKNGRFSPYDEEMKYPIVHGHYQYNNFHAKITKSAEDYIFCQNRAQSPEEEGESKKNPMLKLIFAPKNSTTLKIHPDCFSISNCIAQDMPKLNTIEYSAGLTNSVSGLPNYNHLTSNIKEIQILGKYSNLCDGVFSYYKRLKTVIIGEDTSILYIPKHAFLGCENLKEIKIPSSCHSIEEGSFKDCIRLKRIEFNKRSTKEKTEDESNKDKDKDNNPEEEETKDEIKNDKETNLRFIRKEAFCNCKSLKSITIPRTIFAICEGAFMNCENLKKVIIEIKPKVKETLEIIEKNAFRNCKSLASFRLPRSCYYVGPGSFMDCTSMKTFQSKGRELMSIQSRTFKNCTSLERIEITNLPFQFNNYINSSYPKPVFCIGSESFMNCTSLEEIVIEDKSKDKKTIKYNKQNKKPMFMYPTDPILRNNGHLFYIFKTKQTIEKRAFYNCTALKKARIILGYLSKFEKESFFKCSSLKEIEINSRCYQYLITEGRETFSFSETPKDIELKIMNNNQLVETLPLTNYMINYATEKRHCNKFLSSLEKTLPNIIPSYAEKAIERLSNYKSNSNNNKNRAKLFRRNNCNAQQQQNNADQNQNDQPEEASKAKQTSKLIKEFVIADQIVLYVKKVNKINPSEIEFIMSDYFTDDLKRCNIQPHPIINSPLRTTFDFMEMTKWLHSARFAMYYDLLKIKFLKNADMATIPAFCFAFTGIKTIVIPASVEKIEKFAFYCCSNLEKVKFANNCKLKKIEEGAFSKCQKLTTIELPNKIEEIPKSCFAYSGLQKITLPTSIKKVCSKSFYECRTLSEINLNSGIEMIESYSFYNNISIKELNIPSSLKVLKEYSFCGCENLCKFNTTADTELVEIEEGTFENTNLSELRINRKATKLFTPRNIKTLNSINFYGGSPTHFILTEEGNIYEPIEPNSQEEIEKIRRSSQESAKLRSINNLIRDFFFGIHYYTRHKRPNINYDFNFINFYCDRNKFNPYPKLYTDIAKDYMDIIFYKNRAQSPEEEGESKKNPMLKLIFAPKNSTTLKIHPDCFSISNCIAQDMPKLNTIEYSAGLTNSVSGLPNYNHLTSNIIEIQILGKYSNLCDGVFSYYKRLKTVIIGEDTSILYIPKHAFLGCENLKEIKIPSSCHSIEEGSFKDCIRLKRIEFNKRSTKEKTEDESNKDKDKHNNPGENKKYKFKVGRHYDNDEEEEDIDDERETNLKFIRKEAFCNCKSLKSITIPRTIFAICEGAFMNCENLKKVIIEIKPKVKETLEIIEKNAFRNCKSLSSFRLPRSCYYVGPGSFMDCTSMKTFQSKGRELMSIQSRTFKNCTSLERIEITNLPYYDNQSPKIKAGKINDEPYLNNPIFYIGSESFMNCTSLEEIVIEDKSKDKKTIKYNNKNKENKRNKKHKNDSESEENKDDNKNEENKDDNKNEENKDDNKNEENKDDNKNEENKDDNKNEENKDDNKNEENKDDNKNEENKDDNKNEENKETLFTYPIHYGRGHYSVGKYGEYPIHHLIRFKQTIEKRAFYNCTALKKARIILGNLENIEQESFFKCPSLKEIEINSQYYRYLITEGRELFSDTPKEIELKIMNKNQLIETFTDLDKPINIFTQKRHYPEHLSSLEKTSINYKPLDLETVLKPHQKKEKRHYKEYLSNFYKTLPNFVILYSFDFLEDKGILDKVSTEKHRLERRHFNDDLTPKVPLKYSNSFTKSFNVIKDEFDEKNKQQMVALFNFKPDWLNKIVVLKRPLHKGQKRHYKKYVSFLCQTLPLFSFTYSGTLTRLRRQKRRREMRHYREHLLTCSELQRLYLKQEEVDENESVVSQTSLRVKEPDSQRSALNGPARKRPV